MTVPGWIKLYRKITECEIWKDDDPFSKRDAWIDILLLCNFEEKKTVIGLKTITIEAGSFLTSQDRLAVRWHWGRQKVRDYLKLLERLEMVKLKTSTKYTIIKVPNYEGYQGLKSGEFSQPTNNQQTNQQITNKPTNKITNKNEEENPVDMGFFEGVTHEEEPSKKPTNSGETNHQNSSNLTTTKEYKNIRIKENKEYVVLSKASSSETSEEEYNEFSAYETIMGLPMGSQYLAEKIRGLYLEVGRYPYEKALKKAAEMNKRNFRYVEAVAREIVAGNDFDDKPKNGGALDFEKALKEMKD